jgi:hypothetical protein
MRIHSEQQLYHFEQCGDRLFAKMQIEIKYTKGCGYVRTMIKIVMRVC